MDEEIKLCQALTKSYRVIAVPTFESWIVVKVYIIPQIICFILRIKVVCVEE